MSCLKGQGQCISCVCCYSSGTADLYINTMWKGQGQGKSKYSNIQQVFGICYIFGVRVYNKHKLFI